VTGDHVLTLAGDRRTYRGNIPLAGVAGSLDIGIALAGLELRSLLVNREAPWRSRGARRLDSYSLAHYLRHLRTEEGRGMFSVIVRTVLGAEPSELSFLHFLWYARCAGGVMKLTDFEGGAQDSHIHGGSQQICDRIAAELGDQVSLGTPVSGVKVKPDGVALKVGRRRVKATKVIVAVSPMIAARIDWDPGLPPLREALAQRMPMGAYMKGIAVFDRPWWRDRGLSGLALNDRGPVQMTVDVSPGDDGPGVLAGFVTGAPAREMATLEPAERRDVVLGAMADTLAPEASAPVEYRDFNWLEERWSRGGPVGMMGPGALTGLGPALFEPVGPIHWAGTDSATEWNGYMEGAVQAGERAAREVV
jgi:monoamine oxidase